MGAEPLAPGVISLGPSRMLTTGLLFAAASSCALMVVYLPLLPAMGLSGILLWRAWLAGGLHAWRNLPNSIVGVRCTGAGLECLSRSGIWSIGNIAAGSFVSRFLTVVGWRESGGGSKTQFLVILPDALRSEDFRQLRVHLRWRDFQGN